MSLELKCSLTNSSQYHQLGLWERVSGWPFQATKLEIYSLCSVLPKSKEGLQSKRSTLVVNFTTSDNFNNRLTKCEKNKFIIYQKRVKQFACKRLVNQKLIVYLLKVSIKYTFHIQFCCSRFLEKSLSPYSLK